MIYILYTYVDFYIISLMAKSCFTERPTCLSVA